MEINNNSIIVLTAEQLRTFAIETAKAVLEETSANPATATATEKRYVYGIRGIKNLFNVSHTTAQNYKNTFLAPAVMQRGRKIVVDTVKAMELYDAEQAKKETAAR